MSDLRDARFRKALEHAPDADVRPGNAVRQQVLDRARDAVRAVRPAPWWRAFWATPGQRMPWNAALATIAVASLITVLWHDKEVPEARPEATTASESQPAPAASAAVPSAASPPASAPPASVRASASSAARARTAQPPSLAQASSQRATSAADMAAKAERRPDAASAAGMLRDSAPTELAKAAPDRSESAAQAPAPRAPAARMATQFPPSPVDASTQIHVRIAGRTVDAPLQKPSRLADLLHRIAREPRNADALETGVDTLIELREGGELLAMLELAGEQARWTVLRTQDGASGTVRPSGDLVRQLREELARLPR